MSLLAIMNNSWHVRIYVTCKVHMTYKPGVTSPPQGGICYRKGGYVTPRARTVVRLSAGRVYNTYEVCKSYRLTSVAPAGDPQGVRLATRPRSPCKKPTVFYPVGSLGVEVLYIPFWYYVLRCRVWISWYKVIWVT